jgi:hypothetical protein
MLQGEDIMKSVKDRLFKRIWTVLLALMITVSFAPAAVFGQISTEGSDSGQSVKVQQAGSEDKGGSAEKDSRTEVAGKDGTDSEKGTDDKLENKQELSEKKEENKEENKKEDTQTEKTEVKKETEKTETKETGTTGVNGAVKTETYSVAFECADPAGNVAAVTVGTFAIEKGGKLPSVPDAKDYAGYEFRGWQKEDGSAGPVSGAEIVSAEVTDNVTYAAVYRKKAENTDNNDNTDNGNDINGTSKGTADQASGTAGSSDASGNGSAALKNGPQETGTLVEQDAAQIPQLAVPDSAADLTAMTSKTAGTPGEQQPAEEGKAEYTVVYYLQSEMDPKDAPDSEKTYYFQKEKPLKGKVGENTAPPAKNHYVINNGKTEQKKIASDGSTVVNVYYDLEVQTIRFWIKNPETNKWDKEYCTLTGLYGSEIDSWPSEYHWYGGDENGPDNKRTTFLASFNLDHYDHSSAAGNPVYDFYGKEPGANGKTIMHYKQKPDGSWPGLDEEPTVKTDGSGINFNLSDKFSGFGVYQYSTDGGRTYEDASAGQQVLSYDTLIIWHQRNQYNILFANVKNNIDQQPVTFEAGIKSNIAELTDSITENPAAYVPDGISEDAEFGGWYTEKNCPESAELKADKKMPAHPLTLFAKWNYRWTVNCVDEAGNELMQPIENRECVRSNTPVMAEAPKISGYKAESESQEVNKNNQTITFKYTRRPQLVSADLTEAPRSYNGSAQGFEAITDLQADRGETLQYTYYRIVNGKRIKAGSLKDAGKYEINVSILRNDKKIWSKTFKNIVVSVRRVTLTSASRDKLYDGNLLSGSETDVQIGGDGFVDGEGVDLKMTGSQCAAGSCLNSFTYTAKKGTNLANYEITASYGTLTVNPRTGDDRIDVNIPFDMNHFSLDTKTGKLKGLDGYKFKFNDNTFTLSGLSAKIGGEVDKAKHIYKLKFAGKPVVHDINKNDVTSQFRFNLKDQMIQLNKAFGGDSDGDGEHRLPSGFGGAFAFGRAFAPTYASDTYSGMTGAAGGGTGTRIAFRTLRNGTDGVNRADANAGTRVNKRTPDLISRMFSGGNASWHKRNMDRIKRDLQAKKEEIGKNPKNKKKGLPLLGSIFGRKPFFGIIGGDHQIRLFGIIPISDTAANVTCVLGVMTAALAGMLFSLKKAEKLRAEMTVELEDGGKIPAADSQFLRW